MVDYEQRESCPRMDSSQISSLILFVIFVLMSAFFAASETAFTSVSEVKLKTEAKNGNKKAEKTLQLKQDYNALLTAILIGNNIANIACSAIATLFFVRLMPDYGAMVSTIVTTILLLFLAEVTPKLVAKLLSKQIAMFGASILSVVIILFKPLIWLATLWQDMINRLVPIEKVNSISEAELLSFVDEARSEGSIEAEEHSLVKAAIEFDDVEVGTILTPRVDVNGVDIDATDEEMEEAFEKSAHSRLIVYEESIDHTVGILHQKDFHRYQRAKAKGKLRVPSIVHLISEVDFVPPVMKVFDLLQMMQRKKRHMAVVVDEHGGMLGIVTMEDTLEELVGEIWDETDIIEDEITIVEENQLYEVKGTYSLHKLCELLGIVPADDWISSTVSGFMIEQLERVPQEGDTFIYDHFTFKATGVKQRRVNKVQVKRVHLTEEEHKL
jgi:putative transporter